MTLFELQDSFNTKFKTTSKAYSILEFQSVLRKLSNKGLITKKIDSGYTVHLPNGALVLKALDSSNGYLAKMFEDTFSLTVTNKLYL